MLPLFSWLRLSQGAGDHSKVCAVHGVGKNSSPLPPPTGRRRCRGCAGDVADCGCRQGGGCGRHIEQLWVSPATILYSIWMDGIPVIFRTKFEIEM